MKTRHFEKKNCTTFRFEMIPFFPQELRSIIDLHVGKRKTDYSSKKNFFLHYVFIEKRKHDGYQLLKVKAM